MYKIGQCFVLDDGSVVRILSTRPTSCGIPDLISVETLHGEANYLSTHLETILTARACTEISRSQYDALRQIQFTKS